MLYKHFLLTRFNIKLKYGKKFENPEDNPMLKILDEDYLENRFNIFEKYTFESVKNQTSHDFTWIILFHKKTPEKYLKKIKELKRIYNFEDLYFDDNEQFNFTRYCAENYNFYDYYITTRIDNDDYIDKDYMKCIRDFAEKKPQEYFLSFKNGIQHDLKQNKKYKLQSEANHFISLISPNYKNNVFRYNHTRIFNANIDVIVLKNGKPMWFELIHESNVYNNILTSPKLNDLLLLHNDLFKKYITARVDLKNNGISTNNIKILENSDNNSQVIQPDWFKDENGIGIQIQSINDNLTLKIQFEGDGNFQLMLKGIDFRDNNRKRLPIYINYNNLTINNEQVLKQSVTVCHDNPYVYKKEVKNGEVMNIHIEWTPLDIIF